MVLKALDAVQKLRPVATRALREVHFFVLFSAWSWGGKSRRWWESILVFHMGKILWQKLPFARISEFMW